ncbi:autotransporter domain-containing protein [uncultured Lutibacter sp.]|uniref:autotransporter domain-containing protein n=1 Tax=uncultured Lutibacter sp. TaxID=437739 RepID=UPI002633A2D2|nr:autotransporter domain-containing protein [uncultured Lutibacter sp.]
MRKLFIIALLITFGISFGQEKKEPLNIEKGTWNLGGNFTYSNSSSETNNTSTNAENDQFYIGFYPQVGYAIKNNLIIGMGVGYEYRKNENYYSETEIYNSKQNGIVVFPYVKKFFNVNTKVSFHLQGEFRMSKTWNDNNDLSNLTSNDNNTRSLFVGVRPGLTIFLAKKLALETSIGALGYSTGKNKADSRETKFDSFSFNLNPNNLVFGLSYYF